MKAGDSRFGDILVSSGFLNKDQLSRALREAKRAGCQLAEAIGRLGFSSEEAVLQCLSKELDMAYASDSNRLFPSDRDKELIAAIPEAFAREHGVLPLFVDGKELAVAFWDLDKMAVPKGLLVACGHKVVPFLASRRQLLSAIDRLYLRELPPRPRDQSTGSAALTEIDLSGPVTGAESSDPVVRLNAVLAQAILERCSDIHMEAYGKTAAVLRFRIDGVLHDRPTPSPDLFASVLSRIKILSKLNIAEKRLPQDGTFAVKAGGQVVDFRVSFCPMAGGEKAVLRVLKKESADLDLDAVGFVGAQKADFLEAAQKPHGLIFLTGPTGSGKTTTLYAILNAVLTKERNFMTVEDPVEITLPRVNQAQVRPDIGLTFSVLLRSFLRQDPDVLLVGEVRDKETAHVCVSAALTGRLVLSTLHTNDALATVLRLIDLGVEPFLIANSLLLTAAQRLVRRLCPQCKRPYKPQAAELEDCLRQARLDPARGGDENVVLFEAAGCKRCANTGFMGRTAVIEVIPIRSAMREAIYSRHGDMAHLRRIAAAEGTLSLRAAGFRKVLDGVTTAQEILSATSLE